MKKLLLNAIVIMNLQNKKFSKINFEETDLNQPKTPPKGDEDSFSQMKTK